ncbi:glycosyltransferase [Mangrovimonas sp. AS39]|uniref:glycosyltransferase family 2 protein n=1 Tax=Mangrovimonas futianensis TaxID=2895523 RepID=UPI001E4F43DF|nr:glycosyltransferase [Mangrovimonas futianensis]MCF1190804.1 glycosyltransferase [Mangrovimonas futianensis]MCF1194501.1 glycosyltransferase [Mangrovimonas futianensis]
MNTNKISVNYLYLPEQDNEGIRPLWSVIIPTYNCAHYLKETLQSVLQQDLGPEKMQILVVDDCSTKDNPEAVVKEVGKGRVEFIRQSQNVGKVKNYETGLLKSKGHLIHLLHGDDRVLNGFYKEMVEVFEKSSVAMAAFCRSVYIDEIGRWKGMTGMIQDQEGIVENLEGKLYVEQRIQTPSMVVKREVYEILGTFDRRLDCMEDWEMWVRIANHYPIAVSNKVLAMYRTHSKNATNETFADGSALSVHEKVFDIIDRYIKPQIRKKYYKYRNKKQAEFLLLSFKERIGVLAFSEKAAFIKRILKLDCSLKTLIRLLKN